MSGVEVIAVLGAIGSVIGILNASGDLLKKAKKGIKISKTFKLAADEVPILVGILHISRSTRIRPRAVT